MIRDERCISICDSFIVSDAAVAMLYGFSFSFSLFSVDDLPIFGSL